MIKFHHLKNYLKKIIPSSIQSFAVEVFKVSSNVFAETIIDELFREANHKYILRSKSSH